MAGEYLAAGRKSSGFDALTGGADYYQHAIKRYTTTNMTPRRDSPIGFERSRTNSHRNGGHKGRSGL